ncbi:phosphatidylserine decarboxylase [Ralstonia sp. A12]|uniref:archaetidylserine decarboxylase n=1 Tax=Ralstonia sp. A12 TaxID=1217052 RepID=UPI000574F8F2|nr:archaetidylserine decarboxylase [Ralstonia sp. A12]KHK49828.1 phosphatidylserine decarboxylase [Ralstonia sp. A12]
MFERLFVQLQHLLPKLLITRLLGFLAHRRAGMLTHWVVRRFIARYDVNMAEAAQSEPGAYATFNDFFTRALRPDVRPMATTRLICPVDGAISQFGRIELDQIFQAKGKLFSSSALLAGNEELARQFDDGLFATIYLSPRDYHRVHMPCDGRLLSMSYVPGELYSVNPATARGVDALFANNERVICHIDSLHGAFALVLVGAAIVGSVVTVWHGVVNPPRGSSVRHWDYRDQNITLKQGEEMGRFLLGSTVVLLFPQGPLRFNPDWAPARMVRLGEAMVD